MDTLFSIYLDQAITGCDESELFSGFFSDIVNRDRLNNWLDLLMSKEQLKDDNIANTLRLEGNLLYKKKKFKESLQKYTEALCNANPKSGSYGLILANRSAVFFMMNRFVECLSDINACLKSDCSQATKMKVHIRKVKCCYNTNSDDLQEIVLDALDYLNKNDEVSDKSVVEAEILNYQKGVFQKPLVENQLNDNQIPQIKDGFSSSFLHASSAICLSYDKYRGRHVRANTQISPGDVLFIEKPFIFAPVFTLKNMELPHNKCYNCLRTIYSCIPCKYCIRCKFCNEGCWNASWKEFHKWECRGMRSNLWYHIGIAFPATRALLRGILQGLETLNFNNHENNYLHFNRLITNIDKMKNVLPIVLSAAVVVTYLEKYTDFFPRLLEDPLCPKENYDACIMYTGALLTRHIAQLQCNSSVINHTDVDIENDSVACAIYPSVSMMNHSCKPNIIISYVRDTVIVKAAEVIQTNEEVFNCYGIDYRYLDRSSRQELCQSLYYFTCECCACKDYKS